MNKGKRLLEVDLHSERGRELVTACIAAAGAFLTNFPAHGWLSYDALRGRRGDLNMVVLPANGTAARKVDYTVNPATGFLWATRPCGSAEPLWSVTPGGRRCHARQPRHSRVNPDLLARPCRARPSAGSREGLTTDGHLEDASSGLARLPFPAACTGPAALTPRYFVSLRSES
jgi:hypothetical protein